MQFFGQMVEEIKISPEQEDFFFEDKKSFNFLHRRVSDVCQESDWSTTEAKNKKIILIFLVSFWFSLKIKHMTMTILLWIKINQSSSKKHFEKLKSSQTADTPDYISYTFYKTLWIIDI